MTEINSVMVKLCGLRRFEDIEYVNAVKPDFAGFILAKGYRRTVTPEFAAELVSALCPEIKSVGVFVDQSAEFVSQAAEKIGLYTVQLHGDEDEAYISRLRKLTSAKIWKAARVRTAGDVLKADSLGADMLVLDSFSENVNGGTGKVFNHEIIKNIRTVTPFLLAGGLNADNIEEALKILPAGCGVDLSSGIETDGFKDFQKIIKIMSMIRKGDKNV